MPGIYLKNNRRGHIPIFPVCSQYGLFLIVGGALSDSSSNRENGNVPTEKI